MIIFINQNNHNNLCQLHPNIQENQLNKLFNIKEMNHKNFNKMILFNQLLMNKRLKLNLLSITL